MDIFELTLQQMLSMFVLIVAGYILRTKCRFPPNSDNTIAKLEAYVFVPAVFLHTQMTQCTVESFRQNYPLMLYGLGIVICAIALAYPLSRLFVPKRSGTPAEDYLRNIYRYAMTFGNYGYLGVFIVQGIWGSEMLYKYTLFTSLMGIVCDSWGLYILVPKDQGAGILQNLKTGLIKPPLIALVLGMTLGLTGLTRYIPEFFVGVLNRAGNCQGPVAMVLAGFIIGGYDFKKLLSNGRVYLATFMRLLVIPAVLMLVLKWLGTSELVMTLALIAYAAPIGMNTIVYPAAYGGDTKAGAAMTTISHTLSIITLPLMYLIFIVWM